MLPMSCPPTLILIYFRFPIPSIKIDKYNFILFIPHYCPNYRETLNKWLPFNYDYIWWLHFRSRHSIFLFLLA